MHGDENTLSCWELIYVRHDGASTNDLSSSCIDAHPSRRIVLVLGLGVFLANKIEPPSPDRAFQIFVARVAVDGALLAAGHWLLRSFGLATRMVYGLMGGTAAAVGYAGIRMISQQVDVIMGFGGR